MEDAGEDGPKVEDDADTEELMKELKFENYENEPEGFFPSSPYLLFISSISSFLWLTSLSSPLRHPPFRWIEGTFLPRRQQRGSLHHHGRGSPFSPSSFAFLCFFFFLLTPIRPV